MARFQRLEVLNRLVGGGLLPILYHREVEVVLRAVAGCVEGGARVFEFTHRGDGALGVFEALLHRCRRDYADLVLGVGSIEDPATCAQYLGLGADFVVSPILSTELVRFCNRRKVAHIPGCGSVTEIAAAEELGCELVKLFPASALGGPDFVRALLGPRPWTSVVPTSGAAPTRDNVHAWIDAGCVCLGMGSKLFDVARLESGADPELARRVADTLRWIQEARA